MQIRLRCYSCRTPFAIKSEEIEAALNQLHLEEHKHYNALCPRCGKSNKVSKKQLRRASPGWEPPKPKGEAPKAAEKKPTKPKTKAKTTTTAKTKVAPQAMAKAKTAPKTKTKTKAKAKTKTTTKK